MFATGLQLAGLVLLVTAGALVSVAACVAAVGVACVYIGLAAERD